MGTVFKIAWRNLSQHRSKTILVGVLIAFGIALTFVGNALFESSAKGVMRSFTEVYTGDVMIQAKSAKKFSVFGLDQFSFGNNEAAPVLTHHAELKALLASDPDVAACADQVSGMGFINLDKHGQAYNLMFGVVPSQYFAPGMHPIQIVQGRMLKDGETGIMLAESRVESIAADNHVQLKIGDQILVNSFSKAGLKIRSLPLVATFAYPIPTQAAPLSYVDVQSLRALNAMSLGTYATDKAPEALTKLLTTSDEADFFSDTGTEALKSVKDLSTLSAKAVPVSAAQANPSNPDAWHDVTIRLKPGVSPAMVIDELNAKFKANGWELQAVGWKYAGGTATGLTEITRTVFNAVIIILAMVSAFIILNTLVISVMERTPEIGTMRALGAQKSFVRRLFIVETGTIAGLFGLIGMVIGTVSVLIVGAVGIHIENSFVQLLFGARDLNPELTGNQFLMALILTVAIGAVSWIYPVSIALKVSPLAAITSE